MTTVTEHFNALTAISVPGTTTYTTFPKEIATPCTIVPDYPSGTQDQESDIRGCSSLGQVITSTWLVVNHKLTRGETTEQQTQMLILVDAAIVALRANKKSLGQRVDWSFERDEIPVGNISYRCFVFTIKAQG